MSRARRAVRLSLLCALLAAGQIQGAEHPVGIGFNANWSHWLTRSANVGWVRIDIGWWDVNPQQGVWTFSGTDGRIAEAEANGQQILAILHLVPAWAGGGPNGNVPPLTTAGWSEFVRRLAQQYPNRIAAYEIWNEPDDKDSGTKGIGWDRNIEEPPLYVDFVRAAAMEIRTYSPASLIVAPAFTSRADSASKQNRRRRIFQQIQAASYPNGPGPSFVDVVSYHNNGKDTTSSLATAQELRADSIQYAYVYAPSLYPKPIWVTEYGWRSNAVGENGQREKICNITKIYTGRLEASKTGFDRENIRKAFIFLQWAPSTSQSMFYSESVSAGKPAVTQYLRAMSYPTTQNPAYSAEFPNCSGVFTAASSEATAIAASPSEDVTLVSADELAEHFATLGLGDPAAALPSSYTLSRAEVTNGNISAAFSGPNGDSIRITVSPSLDSSNARGRWSEGGAEWVSGNSLVEIVRPMGEGRAKGLVARVASAVDPSFSSRCLENFGDADLATIRRLGVRQPVPPPGFISSDSLLQASQASKGCGTRSGEIGDFDLLWKFEDSSGAVIRAGIYRYGKGFAGDVENPTSLHWSDGRGTRYWVAVEVPTPTPTLRNAMYEVARSMQPGLSLGRQAP